MLDKVRIISLGGNDERGKTLIVVEVNKDIFVVECGIKFPDKTMHGIDYIVARFDYLIENKDRVKAYFISKGHDIMMGGLPYIYKRVPAPIYCTAVTKIFIDSFAEHNHLKIDFDYRIIEPSDEVRIGDRLIRTFQTATNIAGSFGVAIQTDGGNIIVSSDFVIENDSAEGYKSNTPKLAEIASERTLVALFDSSYAEHPGYANPKFKIAPMLEQTFKEAPGRIFISFENADMYNIENVILLGLRYKRQIIAYDEQTREIFRSVITAHPIKALKKENISSMEDVNRIRPQNVLVFVTGFGNRLFHKIQLLASGKGDKRVRLNPTDTFIIGVPNSNQFETVFTDTVDELYHTDCHIKYFKKWEFIKMHPYQEDIKSRLATFRPKYYIPINGTFKELLANAKTALEMNAGLNHTNVFVIDNGMVVEINDNGAHISQEKINTGDILIDGRDMANEDTKIVQERNLLSDEGVVILGVVVSKKSKKIVAGPDIQTRGLVYVKESEPLLKEINKQFVNIVENEIAKDGYQLSSIEGQVKDALFRTIRRTTMKSPMIIPIIEEIEE
jgi:ribonuclease J